MRIGIDIPDSLPLADQVGLIGWAEEHGFADAWVGDTGTRDPFIVLGCAAQRTRTIRLGTAVAPLGPRSPVSLAVAALCVHELAPGRVALGVGVSSKVIVEQWHGGSYAHPLSRARDCVRLIRQICAGDKTDTASGHARSRGFQVPARQRASLPVQLAALGPRMLELAGEIADGVWLNFVPLQAVPKVLDRIRAGAGRRERPGLPEILLAVPCAVTPDPGSARDRFRRSLYFYMTSPSYRAALAWYGFGEEAAAAEAAWARRDREGVIACVSDRLADQIGVFGSAARCRERFGQYAAAGISTLSVCAEGGDPYQTFAAFQPAAAAPGPSPAVGPAGGRR